MSSLVTEATRALGHAGAADPTRIVAGLVAIAVLLAVLMVREMARAELTGARAARVDHLRFVTVPLTFVFVGVVAPRIVELLT